MSFKKNWEREITVSSIEDSVEKNRSEASDRPRLGKRPSKAEGRDGDTRFVKENDGTYMYTRVSGRWMKARLEDG